MDEYQGAPDTMKRFRALPPMNTSDALNSSLCSMRALLTFVFLLAVSGCSHSQAGRHATTSDSELQRLVDHTVTLRGQFELAGKVGPYIHRTGEPVYLVPHGSFRWGSEYQQMQGKLVSITGILRFRHFERIKTDEIDDRPADYFYFDLETAKVRLE
jgi:hypothetical protein